MNFIFAVVMGLCVQLVAHADGTNFFEKIIEGEYGTPVDICGMHIEKNTVTRKIYIEAIPNYLFRPVGCGQRGLIVKLNCSAVACVGYLEERRVKVVIDEDSVLDDGNIVRTDYRWVAASGEYKEIAQTKFRKL